MRAVVLHGFTTGPIEDVLRVEERERPAVASEDDVIVRVAGAGVCRSDLHIVEGLAIGERPVPLPHVLGHENAGYVADVGPAVTSVTVGDPVLCYPFLTSGLATDERYGRENFVPDRTTPGITTDGGYCEYLRINERSVVPLPPAADPVGYAPLTDAGLAAYRACRRLAGRLKPGQTALVIGAGGLGHLGVQILRLLAPVDVVAIDPKPEARSLASRLGAAAVYPSVEDTEGAPAAVVDFVGSDQTVASALSALPTGGYYVAVGIGGTITLPVQRLVEAELTISGSLVGSYTELVELTRLVADGRIDVVTARYPLDRAAAALTDLRAGRVLGRAVLVPGAG